MPINIQYSPSAAAIGGAALLGGQGDFNRWRAQQQQQAYQFAVGAAQNAAAMNQARALAFAQMANQGAMQQQQQGFELAKLPMQAQIESQQQAYQSGLQNQNQTAQAVLQSQLHGNQDQTDFAQQQELMRQQGAQAQQLAEANQQMHAQGQMNLAQFQGNIKQGQQLQQLLQNPFQQHLQNVQKAQQAGYSFTPEQQTQVDQIKGKIGAIQNGVASGRYTLGTVGEQLRTNVGQLNAITPSQPPPASTQQKVDQGIVMGIRGPDGQVLQGTENTPFTIDAKTGTPMVVRGWKQPDFGPEGPAEEDHSLAAEKVRAQSLKNQGLEANVHMKGFEWANKMVNEEMKTNPFAGVDQMGQPLPGYREQRLAYYQQIYQQQTANTPSGPTAIAPGQQPGGNAPPPQQAPQPQQQPPQAPQPQQAPPQQPQQAPPQQQSAGGLSPQDIAEHAKMVDELPPHDREVVKRLHADGKDQAAMAFPLLYRIRRQYGDDPMKWPPEVVATAKKLRDMMR